MQKCKGCGTEVKYIATGNSFILCDAREIKIVTESGYVRKGYRIHECGGEDGSKRKENS